MSRKTYTINEIHDIIKEHILACKTKQEVKRDIAERDSE